MTQNGGLHVPVMGLAGVAKRLQFGHGQLDESHRRGRNALKWVFPKIQKNPSDGLVGFREANRMKHCELDFDRQEN